MLITLYELPVASRHVAAATFFSVDVAGRNRVSLVSIWGRTISTIFMNVERLSRKFSCQQKSRSRRTNKISNHFRGLGSSQNRLRDERCPGLNTTNRLVEQCNHLAYLKWRVVDVLSFVLSFVCSSSYLNYATIPSHLAATWFKPQVWNLNHPFFQHVFYSTFHWSMNVYKKKHNLHKHAERIISHMNI